MSPVDYVYLPTDCLRVVHHEKAPLDFQEDLPRFVSRPFGDHPFAELLLVSRRVLSRFSILRC